MTISYKTPEDLLGAVGTTFEPTAWVEVSQDRINTFADATGDHQWIHVDVDRAKAESPFGGPIAHGYLTLSLVNMFLPEMFDIEEFSMGVNVGLEKVRFPSPVPARSRVRGVGEIVSAEETKGAIQAVTRVTVEIEGSDKPACVADTVSRYMA